MSSLCYGIYIKYFNLCKEADAATAFISFYYISYLLTTTVVVFKGRTGRNVQFRWQTCGSCPPLGHLS